VSFGYHQEAYWGEGYNDPSYWSVSDGCLVQLNTDSASQFGRLYFRALPNQVIDGAAVSNTDRYAVASGTTYTASLVKKAYYQIYSPSFTFANRVIQVPDAAFANLSELLTKTRRALQ